MPDYPDFTTFSYINIIEQTIERVLVRPTYGGANTADFDGLVTASDFTTLCTVEGEGMLYGAHLLVSGDASCAEDHWLVYIDDSLQAYIKFKHLAAFSMNQPYGPCPVCLKYNDITWRYSFVLPFGFTFDEGIVLKYWERSAETPYVEMIMSYALV